MHHRTIVAYLVSFNEDIKLFHNIYMCKSQVHAQGLEIDQLINIFEFESMRYMYTRFIQVSVVQVFKNVSIFRCEGSNSETNYFDHSKHNGDSVF